MNIFSELLCLFLQLCSVAQLRWYHLFFKKFNVAACKWSCSQCDFTTWWHYTFEGEQYFLSRCVKRIFFPCCCSSYFPDFYGIREAILQEAQGVLKLTYLLWPSYWIAEKRRVSRHRISACVLPGSGMLCELCFPTLYKSMQFGRHQ